MPENTLYLVDALPEQGCMLADNILGKRLPLDYENRSPLVLQISLHCRITGAWDFSLAHRTYGCHPAGIFGHRGVFH